MTSPIDPVNRPTNSGEFSVRVPPSAAELAAFFGRWLETLPAARNWRTAARNYAMARLVAEVGLPAECCALTLDDLHSTTVARQGRDVTARKPACRRLSTRHVLWEALSLDPWTR